MSSPLPEFKPPVFEAVYRATAVASCPECLFDCEDVGPRDLYCPRCRRYWSPDDVGWMEEDLDYYE